MMRYSWNFDEATSSRPSSCRLAEPANQFDASIGLLVSDGAMVDGACAGDGGSGCASTGAAARPQANRIGRMMIRFMAHLTKNAPDGWWEPWSFTWQVRQARSTNREFTVG